MGIIHSGVMGGGPAISGAEQGWMMRRSASVLGRWPVLVLKCGGKSMVGWVETF